MMGPRLRCSHYSRTFFHDCPQFGHLPTVVRCPTPPAIDGGKWPGQQKNDTWTVEISPDTRLLDGRAAASTTGTHLHPFAFSFPVICRLGSLSIRPPLHSLSSPTLSPSASDRVSLLHSQYGDAPVSRLVHGFHSGSPRFC